MSTTRLLLDGWNWNPMVLVAGAAALVIYGRAFRSAARWGYFLAALALVLFTLLSPLNTLAAGVLFSAHMTQHILLLLIAPALLLLSLPRDFSIVGRGLRLALGRAETLPYFNARSPAPNEALSWRGAKRRGHPAGVFRGLPQSASLLRNDKQWVFVASWAAGVGSMWFWHVPAFCNAAATSSSVHAIQTCSLLVMGTAFWWPILAPCERDRLIPGFSIAYLFTACLACTALGIVLTLTPVEVCSAFRAPLAASSGADLRALVGAEQDRQIGGLLMWIPMCLVYLGAIMVELSRWLGASSTDRPAIAPQLKSLR